jgi:hypothetical protein
MMGAALRVPRIMVVAADAISSRLIEGFGGGRWSHMANILTSGTILDARDDWTPARPGWDSGNGVLVDRSGKVKPGVRLRPGGYLDGSPRWAVFEGPADARYAKWEAAGRSILGRPYDSVGIEDFAVGLFTGRYDDKNYAPKNPAASKAFFCDEASVFMAATAGYFQWPPLPIFTLTPGAALNLFIGAGWKLIRHRG